MHKEYERDNFFGGMNFFFLGWKNVLETFRIFLGWKFEKEILLFLEKNLKLLKPQIWKKKNLNFSEGLLNISRRIKCLAFNYH
jgi:hypothetical protein